MISISKAKMQQLMRRRPKGKPVVYGRQGRKLVLRRPALQRLKRELKFFDTAVSFLFDLTSEVPATGQWALIPQGDTASSRDGRQALVKSIEFRGAITGTTTQSLPATELVIWVMLDRQANGAAAAVADVFTGTNVATCLRNLNNNKRFRILKKIMVAPATVGLALQQTGANLFTWPVEFFIPCNILMEWNSTTGAITEITQNNIFIIAGNVSGGGVDDEYTMTGNARLRFYAD